MKHSRFYNLIIHYNLGKLPHAEAEKFKEAMLADPELAAAVKAHQKQYERHGLMSEDALRAEILKRLSEIPPGTGVSPAQQNRFFRNWILLAILLLLATSGVLYFLQNLIRDRQSPPTPPPVQMEKEPAKQ